MLGEKLRRDLYRAIYSGKAEEAENVMNIMALNGIDRDLIWEARGVPNSFDYSKRGFQP